MYKYPCISIQMVIIVVFDQLSYFKRYYTFVVIILTICYICCSSILFLVQFLFCFVLFYVNI